MFDVVNKIGWRRLLLIVGALIFWLIPICFDITFSSIDDCFYMWIMSGDYTGTNSPLAPFIGYVYSIVVMSLYKISNGIESYILGFYVQMFVCYLVFLHMIINSKLSKGVKIALYVAITAFQVYIEFQPHNGIVGIEDAVAAFMLLFFCDDKKKIALAYVLFFFSTQMRWEGAFIPFMVGFPIFLYGFSFKNIRKYRLPICKLIGVLVVAFLALFVNKTAYPLSQEWKNFSKSNSLRGYIVDNTNNEDVFATLTSKKDSVMYDLTAKCRMADPSTMDYQSMSKHVNFLKSQGLHTAKSCFFWYYGEYKVLGCWWVALLGIVCLFIIFKTKDLQGLLLLVSSLVMFVLGNYYMMSQSRPKGRLLIPFLVILSFVYLWIIYQRQRKYFTVTTILVCILFSVTYSRLTLLAHQQTKQQLFAFDKMEKFLKTVPDKKVMTCVSPYPEVFHVTRTVYGSKTYFPDWEMCTPLSPSGQGIAPLLNGMSVFCSKSGFATFSDVTLSYISIFYGIKLRPIIVKQDGEYILARFVK